MTRLRARLLRGGPAFVLHSRDYSELESFREHREHWRAGGLRACRRESDAKTRVPANQPNGREKFNQKKTIRADLWADPINRLPAGIAPETVRATPPEGCTETEV
jgi:hypothetical protein